MKKILMTFIFSLIFCGVAHAMFLPASTFNGDVTLSNNLTTNNVYISGDATLSGALSVQGFLSGRAVISVTEDSFSGSNNDTGYASVDTFIQGYNAITSTGYAFIAMSPDTNPPTDGTPSDANEYARVVCWKATEMAGANNYCGAFALIPKGYYYQYRAINGSGKWTLTELGGKR